MSADAAIWHDVECASYAADLDVWCELAVRRAGRVLDVGCGTGRVALELATRGARVTALDSDPALVRELAARARARGQRIRTVVADARSFELDETFALAIAPMQVAQLLGGSAGRAAMLAHVHRHLEPGGLLAVALADPFEGEGPARPPLPDVLERNGWVYASTPLSVYADGDAMTIERLREAVSPEGELNDTVARIRLDAVTPDDLHAEAAEHGFIARPPRSVPATADYVGSTVVLLERPS